MKVSWSLSFRRSVRRLLTNGVLKYPTGTGNSEREREGGVSILREGRRAAGPSNSVWGVGGVGGVGGREREREGEREGGK